MQFDALTGKTGMIEFIDHARFDKGYARDQAYNRGLFSLLGVEELVNQGGQRTANQRRNDEHPYVL